MSHIRLERTGFIAHVILDRPEARNAFTTEMARQIAETFRSIAHSDARVALLRSSSGKAFCSGADLKERNGMTDQAWKDQHLVFEEMFNAVADTPQPVIAVVDGYALAGGFELALNCDMIVAANTAVFGLPEVTRGIMPGGAASRLLPKRIGVHIAKEWLCSGRLVSAEEAYQAGLLNRLTDSENLLAAAMEIAEKIAENAPLAVQNCKRAAEELFAMEKEEARKREIEIYNLCVNSEDRLEGVRAFVEKRKPAFKGK